MRITQVCRLRGLKKIEYQILREMCFTSRNLYNVALYNIRQSYFNTGKPVSYFSNCKLCRTNENFSQLQSHMSQHTLKKVSDSFNSFLALKRKALKGEYDMDKVEIPHYLKKNDLFSLIFPSIDLKPKNGYITIPYSRKLNKMYPKIKIKVPEGINLDTLKLVEIVPRGKGLYFTIHFVYEIEVENLNLSRKNALAIDIGLNNLATCATSSGSSFIIDGKQLKSINCYFNKKKAKLQSILDKQNYKYSKKYYRLQEKRNNKVNDYIKKSARYIINYCISNDIGIIVIGVNKEMKQNINLGKRNNQQFQQVPFYKFRCHLKYLCNRYGIRYVEQTESYTSKASFFDEDEIPTEYKEGEKPKFSGRRIKRGLYKTKEGYLINADVNAALNILKLSKQNTLISKLSIGCMAHPYRIRIF